MRKIGKGKNQRPLIFASVYGRIFENMPDIQIKSKTEIRPYSAKATGGQAGWKFIVVVDGVEFEVEVGKEYWKKLTGLTGSPPEELVKRSFEFLLKREPKSAILKKFNLSVIQTYFPEYESAIQGD